MAVAFNLGIEDKEFFIKKLFEFYRFYENKSEAESKQLASVGIERLISGQDLNGKVLDNSNLQFFDVIVENQTRGYYRPSQANKFRFQKGAGKKRVVKKGRQIDDSSFSSDDLDKVETIKQNLLVEYPFLNRIDLREDIDNYCKIKVKINNLLSSNQVLENAMLLKNLTETQIKLGGYLGIDESQKAKQKSIDDRQSVAALSLKFQQTIENLPDIIDMFRYQEVQILLQKLDRKEISRELFELPSYAGMSVENARVFVKDRELKYERK